MTLKTWVLGRVHRTGGVLGRGDLPRREPSSGAAAAQPPGPSAKPPDSVLSTVEHLGAYAALIAAIRDELEHFVASHVRLHLAIADHDRFLLTSIGVSCPDAGDARRLLQQFIHEFKPEQVKRYLAREVIGALPNAAAIDLSQFAGLLDGDAQAEAEAADDSGYGELLAALRTNSPAPTTRAYKVNIVGRWTEQSDRGQGAPAANQQQQAGPTPSTPLAGQRCDFDIEDGDGRRRVVLHAVVPGRRYVIGKDPSCDIRVNGTYTSRRHAEIWLEGGNWHVTDAGSTNGVRVESPAGTIERCVPATGRSGSATIVMASGARVVLSAHAEGPAGDYPSLGLRLPGADLGARSTPIAASMAPKTPLTPIHSSRAAGGLVLTVQGGGAGPGSKRTLDLQPGAAPVTVGRSRNQTLVLARAHELVSGHHLDIVATDDSCAQVVVHGDNGVIVDGVSHAVGARFVWKIGQSMVLGPVQADGRACTLTLSRHE